MRFKTEQHLTQLIERASLLRRESATLEAASSRFSVSSAARRSEPADPLTQPFSEWKREAGLASGRTLSGQEMGAPPVHI